MTTFSPIQSRAAWLDEDNIDTDTIYPARFLMVLDRTGLGKNLFRDRRFEPDHSKKPDFVLNRPEYDGASILVAGKNFGCGSSREHAVWSLHDYGIRCVIAEGFSEIFYANAIRNGVLPIIAGPAQAEAAMEDAKALTTLTINLQTCRVSSPERSWSFEIDEMDRQTLLNGWDDSERILNMHRADIERFEAEHRRRQPWLFLSHDENPSSKETI